MEYFLSRCGKSGNRSSVKRVFKGDNVVAMLTFIFNTVFSCNFDSASLASAPEFPKKTLRYPVSMQRRSAKTASGCV